MEFLQGVMAPARLCSLLRLLAESEDEGQETLFQCYLQEACRTAGFTREILPRIRLRDRTGTWREASQLALGAVNLQRRFLVCEHHGRIISVVVRGLTPRTARSPTLHVMPPAVQTPSAADLRRSGEVLAKYLGPWSELPDPHAALGAFVSLFGKGEAGCLDALARRFLGQAPDHARRDLLFKTVPNLRHEHSLVEDTRFAFRTAAPAQAGAVTSLTGDILNAQLSDDLDEILFVGQIPNAKQGGWITLREIAPCGLSPEARRHLLARSTIHLLREAYSLDADYEALDCLYAPSATNTEERVNGVQHCIFEDLAATIRMLGLQSSPPWAEAWVRLYEALLFQGQGQAARAHQGGTAATEVQNARKQLQALLTSSEPGQREILRAVRDHLKTHQYQPGQVLFELFQNADDATTQLMEMSARTVASRWRRFQVIYDDGARVLEVKHFGRPINRQIGEGDFRDGPDRGYGRDLLNMLELHQSEKRREHGVTGRFGLGFKSTYLICDRPQVYSADLAVEIVGGLLPRTLRRSTESEVPAHEGPPATWFSLVLRPDLEPQATLERFVAKGGLLPVFAQSIRTIEVQGLNGSVTRQSTWSPMLVAGMEVGSISPTLSGPVEELRLLVARDKEYVVAFGMDSRGVATLPVSLPTFWCVTPLQELSGLGFCIGAPFAVDVGRGQLARDAEANLACFQQIGLLIATKLCALFDAFAASPEQVSKVLGLAGEPRDRMRSFFTTLFFRLTSNIYGGALDVRRLLGTIHAPGRGLPRLVVERQALPTGLTADHEVLTRLQDVRYFLNDEVMAVGQVFSVLSRWPGIATWLKPGAVISKSLYTLLEHMGCQPVATPVTWQELLKWAQERQVQPSQEDPGLLPMKSWPASVPGDVLTELKRKLRFKTQGDTWRSAAELLKDPTPSEGVDPSDRDEEMLRAACAPRSRLLHQDYGSNQTLLEFFTFTRERMQAGADVLVSWAHSAEGSSRQRAVFQYLLNGEIAKALAEQLLGRKPRYCETSSQLRCTLKEAGFREQDITRLLALLFPQVLIARTEDIPDLEEDDTPELPGPPDQLPHDWLLRVSKWWLRRRDHWLGIYTRQVYGNLSHNALQKSLRAEGTSEQRMRWLHLLTLGASQRFGRVRASQTAGFINKLMEEGNPIWWTIIVKERPEASEWINILEQWFATKIDEEQYSLWLSLYPFLYQFSRFGEVYRQLLFNAARRGAVITLEQLLTPRADPSLVGAGAQWDAPPAARALGLGGVFVMRELLRLKVIERASSLVPYCYVPWRRLRDRVAMLDREDLTEGMTWGAWSSRIDRCLRTHLTGRDATFCGDFDIPLYLALYDDDARAEVDRWRP